jgi:hypothetical protein
LNSTSSAEGGLRLLAGVRVGDPREDVAVGEAGRQRAPGGERGTLGQGDQLLDERLDGLRLGHGRGDLAMLEQPRSQVAQHGATVVLGDVELVSGDAVAHVSGSFRAQAVAGGV